MGQFCKSRRTVYQFLPAAFAASLFELATAYGEVLPLRHRSGIRGSESLNGVLRTLGGRTRSYAGEAEFGPEAAIDFNEFQLRWFDHWLKGVDDGVDREPPVRIFVMGGGDAHRTPEGRIFVGGHWRQEWEWPLARTSAIPYYLHANGVLATQKPEKEEPNSYEFDPRHPVPTLGGNISSHNAPPSHHNTIERPGDSENLMEQGAYDQRCRAEVWTCVDTRPLSTR